MQSITGRDPQAGLEQQSCVKHSQSHSGDSVVVVAVVVVLLVVLVHTAQLEIHSQGGGGFTPHSRVSKLHLTEDGGSSSQSILMHVWSGKNLPPILAAQSLAVTLSSHPNSSKVGGIKKQQAPLIGGSPPPPQQQFPIRGLLKFQSSLHILV